MSCSSWTTEGIPHDSRGSKKTITHGTKPKHGKLLLILKHDAHVQNPLQTRRSAFVNKKTDFKKHLAYGTYGFRPIQYSTK